jgi:hypothetical protein
MTQPTQDQKKAMRKPRMKTYALFGGSMIVKANNRRNALAHFGYEPSVESGVYLRDASRATPEQIDYFRANGGGEIETAERVW